MAKNDQTTVNLPEETKKKVRVLAAEMGTSMGKMALLLIKAGLEDYQRQVMKKDKSTARALA